MTLRSRIPARATLRLFLPFLLALPASAQAPSALVGTWTLVQADNILPDGSRVHLYGEAPDGVLTFDARGTYTVQILRHERPRFASGDKACGTDAENRAAVQGNNSHFGHYSVGDGVLSFRIEHAFFPNWEGTEQVRRYRLEGGELVYTVPAPTTGAGVGEVRWKRAQ